MTSRPPRDDSVNGPPTPKVTGSLAIADGIRKMCDDLARTLEATAIEGARTSGRPDLQMRRVALKLRDVARRVSAWHAGAGPTVSPDQRGQDHTDAMLWLAEAQDLLRARGETIAPQ